MWLLVPAEAAGFVGSGAAPKLGLNCIGGSAALAVAKVCVLV